VGIPKGSFPKEQIPAGRALEVLTMLISTPAGRKRYNAAPEDAFNKFKAKLKNRRLRNADYGAIPENSRKALEALSVYELQLWSDLDKTFVADGLFVEVPSPGSLHWN
jgi:hypothetical protein